MTEAQSSPPPRSRRMPAWAIASLVLLALLVVGMVIAYQSRGAAAAGAGAGATGPYTVTIEGGGTATVALDEDGASSEQTDVVLPFTETVPAGTRLVSVVAQLTGEYGNEVSCSLTDAAGDVLKSAQSSGQYTTVTCAAALG